MVLINNSLGGIGNDLAIDDISFRPCGHATSYVSTVPEIFTTRVCVNNQSFTLTASINSNTFQNVNYIWQVSKDRGGTWTNLAAPSSVPTITITAGDYQDFYQYRFIVGESSNILTQSCRVISKPITAGVYGYPSNPVVNPISICQNSVSNISVPFSGALWYSSATVGIGSAVAPKINTTVLGTSTFWVSQVVYGCESGRTRVDITVYPYPSAPNVVGNGFIKTGWVLLKNRN